MESIELHLDDDPLVCLVLQDTVGWIGLNLLSDGRGNGRDEGQWVEVQVITEDLSEHLRCHQLLCKIKKQNKGIVCVLFNAMKSLLYTILSVLYDFTVHIPGESVSELLSLNLHVQTDWNQNFRLGGIFVDHCWIVVIKAAKDKRTEQHLAET